MINTFLKWLAIVIALYILQTTIIPVIAIGGVKPDLLILVLFFLGHKTDAIPAVIAGFFIGLAQDFYSPEILGQNALSKSIAGFFAGLLNERVMRIDPFFLLVLFALSFLIHDIVYFAVLMGKTEVTLQFIGMELLTSTLPKVLYTLLFALIPTFKEFLFPTSVRR